MARDACKCLTFCYNVQELLVDFEALLVDAHGNLDVTAQFPFFDAKSVMEHPETATALAYSAVTQEGQSPCQYWWYKVRDGSHLVVCKSLLVKGHSIAFYTNKGCSNTQARKHSP